MKYEVGDLVVCVRSKYSYPPLVEGRTYTVKRVEDCLGGPQVFVGTGPLDCYNPDRFAPFVGDIAVGDVL